ncbi:hypothetical protein ScPMuIL_009420 [Solemya velum]
MSSAYGVRFGSSTSSIAACEEGKTIVLANELGDRVTPCVVAFTEHDQVVGQAAKQGIIRNADNTICNAKLILGHSFSDPCVTHYNRNSSVSVIDLNGKPVFQVKYKDAKKTVTTEDVTQKIYQYMLETAKSHGGSSKTRCVLTAPVHFTMQQREILRKCAVAAGFVVMRVISEPAAALLAYDVGQEDCTACCTVLVLRIGGASSDVTVLAVRNGMYQIQASYTDSDVGGDRFTEMLAKHLTMEFRRQSRQDISENRRSVAKLRLASERELLSRARFENECSSLIAKCEQLITKVLTETGKDCSDFDKVILCGGGTRIPMLQKTIEERFPNAELLSSIPPDEVVAQGAAKEAAILLSYEEKEISENAEETEMECLSSAISVKAGAISVEETSLVPVFLEMTPFHTRRHHSFQLEENQTSFCLEVVEVARSSEPRSLAKLVMRDLNPGTILTATFHLKGDGGLHVTCTDGSSSHVTSVNIDIVESGMPNGNADGNSEMPT